MFGMGVTAVFPVFVRLWQAPPISLTFFVSSLSSDCTLHDRRKERIVTLPSAQTAHSREAVAALSDPVYEPTLTMRVFTVNERHIPNVPVPTVP
jgi:hypothetical protein